MLYPGWTGPSRPVDRPPPAIRGSSARVGPPRTVRPGRDTGGTQGRRTVHYAGTSSCRQRAPPLLSLGVDGGGQMQANGTGSGSKGRDHHWLPSPHHARNAVSACAPPSPFQPPKPTPLAIHKISRTLANRGSASVQKYPRKELCSCSWKSCRPPVSCVYLASSNTLPSSLSLSSRQPYPHHPTSSSPPLQDPRIVLRHVSVAHTHVLRLQQGSCPARVFGKLRSCHGRS